MRGKVSMVMPCWNKVGYIGEMFDSILAQEWDNIELVLVNDGSTDGTRGVIAEYEPKFTARGYEVVIIDQENAGVCEAAKAGLGRVTGDYVCLVDADDELDPAYASTMAGWLDGNPEYDYCVCEAVVYTGTGKNKRYDDYGPGSIPRGRENLLEGFMLADMRQTVWVYMSRAAYLKKCRIPETYYTDTKGSHEPGFVVPLLAHGGKYKHFELPLYRLNIEGEGHSRPDGVENKLKFYSEYGKLSVAAVNGLPDGLVSPEDKKRLILMADFTKYAYLCMVAKGMSGDAEFVRQSFESWAEAANALLPSSEAFDAEDFVHMEYEAIYAVKDKLTGFWENTGKIIGYGALGIRGRKILPSLKGTALEPCELWDKNGGGTDVKTPDFPSLTENDLVICFPLSTEILDEVKRFAPCRVVESWRVIGKIYFELVLKKKMLDIRVEPVKAEKASGKIKMLVISNSFETCGGVERFLLNFLKIFPEEKYSIDLALFSHKQDEAKMFDMIPAGVNILPALNQLSSWAPSQADELRGAGKADMAVITEMIHLRNISENFSSVPVEERFNINWNDFKRICPTYEGYDIAVAFRTALPLKIAADMTAGARKFAFIHLDYKSAVESGSIDKEYYLCEQAYLAKMDGVFCVSEQNAEALCEYMPALKPKIKVITNVNNPAYITRMASAFYPKEYENAGFVILTVGRIHSQKGIDLLLNTAAKLKEKSMVFKWFVLGKDPRDGYSKTCVELREKLGLMDSVIYLGERPNPFPYYKHCDLYAQPSRYEGRPLAVEEAMTLARPVVTTDYLSTYDQIKDGVNGRVCPREPDALADVIYGLYADRGELNRLALGNAGYTGDSGKEKYFEYLS